MKKFFAVLMIFMLALCTGCGGEKVIPYKSLTHEEAIKMICDDLSSTQSNGTVERFDSLTVRTTVRINTGICSKIRNIALLEKSYMEVFESDIYLERLRTLPDICENSMRIFADELTVSTVRFTNDKVIKKIYDTLSDEMKTVDIKKWSELQKADRSSTAGAEMISFPARSNGRYFNVTVMISKELTPKTFQAIVEERGDFIYLPDRYD